MELEGGASTEFDLTFEYLPNQAAVTASRERIAKLQTGGKPQIHATPVPGWVA